MGTAAVASSDGTPPLSADTRPSTPPAGASTAKKQRRTEPTIHEINQITGVCEMEVLETAEQLMSSSSEGASRLLTARRAHLAK